MEIRNIFGVLLLLLGIANCNVCSSSNEAQQFDWNGATAVQDSKMNALQCVKDTQIDFNFPSASTGNLEVHNMSSAGYLQYHFVRFPFNPGQNRRRNPPISKSEWRQPKLLPRPHHPREVLNRSSYTHHQRSPHPRLWFFVRII